MQLAMTRLHALDEPHVDNYTSAVASMSFNFHVFNEPAFLEISSELSLAAVRFVEKYAGLILRHCPCGVIAVGCQRWTTSLHMHTSHCVGKMFIEIFWLLCKVQELSSLTLSNKQKKIGQLKQIDRLIRPVPHQRTVSVSSCFSFLLVPH